MLVLCVLLAAWLVLVHRAREPFAAEDKASPLYLLPGTHAINVQRGMGADAGKAFVRTLRFDRQHLAATVRFDISFGKNFDFGCRGKVGGFQIGAGASAGERHSPWGSSFRVMWNSAGGAYMYVYFPTGWGPQNPNGAGMEYYVNSFPGAFSKNTDDNWKKWHTVTMSVRLNSFDGRGRPQRDGKLTLNVDGTVRALSGVVMRISPRITLNDFVFNFFHGGPCRAGKDMTAWVRDVRLVR